MAASMCKFTAKVFRAANEGGGRGRASTGDAAVTSALTASRPTATKRRVDRVSNASRAAPIEVDRAAEQIEEWLLQWLVNRLSMDPTDVARDRPFAEFGVDSLTAVELSQELEDEFEVPLPAIVAWNYPTPAALGPLPGRAIDRGR